MAMKSGKFFEKLSLLMLVLMYAGAVAAGSEPAPPPDAVQYKGPAVIGDLILTPGESCGGVASGCIYADLHFTGKCKSQSVSIMISDRNIGGDITAITEADLTGFYLGSIGLALTPENPPLMCNSNATQGGVSEGITDPAMIINTVNRLTNINGNVNANIILLFAPLSNNPNDGGN